VLRFWSAYSMSLWSNVVAITSWVRP
ncbi:hypothetical protein CCACVL1_19603, partial [Corchorus capsularis]